MTLPEFTDRLCRRMCPRCAQGHTPTLDRGVWCHVFNEVDLATKSSLHKMVEKDFGKVERIEQICRAGEVRQLLSELEREGAA